MSPLTHVVLLQVREDDRPAQHERLCFLERLGVEPEVLRSVNVLKEPVPSRAALDGCQLLLMGGSGECSAVNEYAFTQPLERLLREVVEAGVPFFGSCFGHQFLARALGGSVLVDRRHAEIGTYDIQLTAAGRADPLLSPFPNHFPVHLGHHDRIDRPPPRAVTLASSGFCAHQMIRIGELPIYTTQFHCEMSDDHMRQRLLMYIDDYLEGEDPVAELETRLRPASLVETLLPRFLELFL